MKLMILIFELNSEQQTCACFFLKMQDFKLVTIASKKLYKELNSEQIPSAGKLKILL